MSHEHTYQVAQIKNNFEPWNETGGRQLYILVEYMYLYCPKCGDSKKREITYEKG